MWKYSAHNIYCFLQLAMYFYILMDVCLSKEKNVSDQGICNDGFTGLNCKIRCRYPGFGKSCQSQCNCPQMYCNSATGCEDGSPTLSPVLHTTKSDDIHSVDHITFSGPACPPGYTGNSCELQCRYPSYGIGCQSMCDNCSKEQCNHVTGCNDKIDYCHLKLDCKGCNASSKQYHREDNSRRHFMLYSIVVLSVWMLVQFSMYLYLMFFFKQNN